ncbi:MAG: tripartite tricarboxylate transporter substrate binding protein [Burkholderiales bacterium]
MTPDPRRLPRAMLAALIILLAAPAAIAAWPDDGPIRIIVPQAAGGTNDTLARLVGVELGKLIKQSVIVENRPGAAGAIGMQAVAQSRPDGYTLGLASDSAAMLDVTKPGLPWKFRRDLQGVGMIGDQPICVAVSARSSFKSFGDVLKAAREKPAALAYGTSGIGTSQHVVGEWLARLAGVQLLHVPYKGGGQATADIVSGQVPVAVLGLVPMLAQAKAGKVHIVAVTTPKRASAVPDVPTTGELGYPQIALSQWAGLVVPAATPESITRPLSEAILAVIAGAETRQKLAEAGIDAKPIGYQAFDRFLKDSVDTWTRVVPGLQLKLD